jgi:16S rRNA (uracil1498-N3)-methyltransferase
MKKVHRFLIPQTITGDAVSTEESDLVHLIKNVLKLTIGEHCILFFDTSDDYLCTISSIEKKSVTFSIDSTLPKKKIPRHITACISIIKRDNFELTVQKLTELGVQSIIPIISERTIKQSLRTDRLQKISDEALEQSGGSTRVHISEPKSLKEVLSSQTNASQYYFDMGGASLVRPEESTDITIYIGPEGGWSDGDLALFKEYKLPSYTLGETVLRAETAAIVASYTLLWH